MVEISPTWMAQHPFEIGIDGAFPFNAWNRPDVVPFRLESGCGFDRRGDRVGPCHHDVKRGPTDAMERGMARHRVLQRPKRGIRSVVKALEEAQAKSRSAMVSPTPPPTLRKHRRDKAEMYVVRTDGFTCNREIVQDSTLKFAHPSTQQQMLMWKTRPKRALVLKKLGDELLPQLLELAEFLFKVEGITVLVEPHVHRRISKEGGFEFVETFSEKNVGMLEDIVDFVVCLGGDGVILHSSSLFARAIPPVISFNLGSMGFLTSHNFQHYREDLQSLLCGEQGLEGVFITLRMRLRCQICRKGEPLPGKTFEVMNEVVIDRGANPFLSMIECYERGRLITKVQADGVMVATPTGSTAYSVAAGGSMVHPTVPCMLFTPICPHSLSFRPVILPDSAELELKIPHDSRSTGWVCFDGKWKQELNRGDSVLIKMSEFPMPTVNKSDQTDDWFASLIRCLSWNERLEQGGRTMDWE